MLVEKPISNDIGEDSRWSEAAEKDLYLGCNLNHYFTPPAEGARTWKRQVGELLYCLQDGCWRRTRLPL